MTLPLILFLISINWFCFHIRIILFKFVTRRSNIKWKYITIVFNCYHDYGAEAREEKTKISQLNEMIGKTGNANSNREEIWGSNEKNSRKDILENNYLD